jgi:hypothetical protein
MRRLLSAALSAGAFSWSLFLEAQNPAGVALTLMASPLSRGQTSVLAVKIEIPAGWFIPAETRGSVQGAWLRPETDGLLDRELPTFPIPSLVRLAGSDQSVLAYGGTIVVRLPVEAWLVSTPARNIGVRFGYQLCNVQRCDPFRTESATARVAVNEPSTPSGALAVRIDASGVAVISSMRERHDSSLPFSRIPPAFVTRMAVLPNSHPASARFDGDFQIGSRWTVGSGGRRFEAVAVEPAAFYGGCEDIMPLALVARVDDPSFRNERAKYFVALPRDKSRSNGPVTAPLMRLTLTDAERRDLEQLLDHQMRITYPSLFAPEFRNSVVRSQPSETAHDRRIRNGEGRLEYHAEAFRLAPDADARLYVRAFWAIGGVARIGLTAWVRTDGQRFTVERSDASVSRFAQFGEMKFMGSDIAARPEYGGTLLNVVAAPDGWAYVIIGRRGYESVGVTVRKYSAGGPIDTGIAYSYGC